MTEPIHAKVSDEDYQKVLDAFNNPQPYPEEMLEQVENHLTLKHEEMLELAEKRERSNTVLARYNHFYNQEVSGLPHGMPTSMEQLQAMALECMVDALICENMNVEYNVIAIDDIKDLIEGLYRQSNEFLERVRTVQEQVHGHTKTDLDTL